MQIDIDTEIARCPSPRLPPDEWNLLRLDPEFCFGIPQPTWEEMRGKRLVLLYKKDLGADLSEAKAALLERIVVLQVWCEVVDSRFFTTGGLPDEYTKNTTMLLRLLKELGLERRAKVASDLASYLAGKVGNDVAKAVAPDGRELSGWLVG
ncbi:hypothetical protein QO058_01540 [Bosea vestrisii]|uniref:hypothetical protein n=1 Tax=Bosea vestrisii TaxID=151416 RepID=UPI0024DF6BC3|nr:hypothetical protein [Bosea vestrisii]WID96995.1 hypothetical protein QO058_01540 [Bosea vestrisii]